MATSLTPEQMKLFIRNHFEEFVNRRNASVIRQNMTSDFYDHDGPGGSPTGIEGDEQMMLGMYKHRLSGPAAARLQNKYRAS